VRDVEIYENIVPVTHGAFMEGRKLRGRGFLMAHEFKYVNNWVRKVEKLFVLSFEAEFDEFIRKFVEICH
jgi:hypothetical protein